MDFWSFLNHWWNLPALVMLGLCAAFLLLQALGLIGGSSDHEPAELDADAEHELEVAADADTDVDADAELDTAGADLSAWQQALGFLGVGHVPFMVVWVSLFLCAGFAGLLQNRVLVVLAGTYRAWWFVPVQALAFGAGVIGARAASRLAARFVDVGGRGATKKHELTGRLGVVASLVLSDRFGEIRVNDARGNELLVHGRLATGEAPLARAASVVLVDFDPDRELFAVAPCPELSDSARH